MIISHYTIVVIGTDWARRAASQQCIDMHWEAIRIEINPMTLKVNTNKM